jgi:truncated hemoglobin YjbI
MNDEFSGDFRSVASYGDVAAMSYEEFEAWAAYFHHAHLHATDKAAQDEHDRVMAMAARAAAGG